MSQISINAVLKLSSKVRSFEQIKDDWFRINCFTKYPNGSSIDLYLRKFKTCYLLCDYGDTSDYLANGGKKVEPAFEKYFLNANEIEKGEYGYQTKFRALRQTTFENKLILLTTFIHVCTTNGAISA